MCECHMDLVHAVFKALQVVTWHVLGVPDLDDSFSRPVRERRKRRRLAFAEVREDQAEVLTRRICLYLYLVRETGFFSGLLNTLARTVELPPVVDATDGVRFDPAEMHLRSSMRTSIVDDLSAAGLPAIERIVLAYNTYRFGISGTQVLTSIYCRPELAH